MVSYGVKLVARIPVDTRLNMRPPEVRSAMLEGYRQTFRTMTGIVPFARSLGPKGRSIYGELANMRNLSAQQLPGGDVTVTGRVNAPHAGIQNFGGTIRERVAIRAKAMRFVYKGRVRFARRVRPSRIRARHYIERGLNILARRIKAPVEIIHTWKNIGGVVR